MLRLIPRLQDEAPQALLRMGLPDALARILWARGVRTEAEAQAFLNPQLSMLHDPFALHDMDRAVERIRQAVSAGESIVVYGDYDVDGVCATALLVEALREHGARASWYIPSRHQEGYGLNEDAVRRIAHSGASLLISVDCGITSIQEAEVAKECGLTLIITDHHEPPERLPEASAVINPILGDYPFRRLCGAGVAFKLAQALFGLEALDDKLELVALATVADLVPLLGENRVLVYHGLKRLNRTRRAGLKALLKVSGLEGKVVTAGHLGFQIGPRINAGGRLRDASRNVTLLLTEDAAEAADIARALSEENQQRQRLEADILEQAEGWVREHVDFLTDKVALIVGQGWNPGVVGLVASRLVEKFAWPAVVLSEADGVLTGSARSIPGINLHTALSRCADLFLRFGGHAHAAGMTLPAENLPALRVRLNEAIADIAEEDAFIPAAFFDLDMPLKEIGISFIEQLEGLAPTGFGNPAPVFRLTGAHVLEARGVGVEGKHLKLRLSQQGAAVDGIAFGQGAQRATLPETIDALFSPSINEYMGKRSAQMEIARLLPHRPAQAFREKCLAEADAFDLYLLDLARAEQDASPDAADPAPVRRALIAQALTASPQGAFLAARTMEGALHWLDWLEAEGLSDRVSYCFGQPEDIRRFNVLCAMPSPRAGEGYTRRFALDDERVPGAASAWMPTDDGLRALYRVLRMGQGRFRSEAALSEAAGIRVAAVRLGLRTFEELGLVAYQAAPFQVLLLSPVKCSLSDSAALRRARRMLRREVWA